MIRQTRSALDTHGEKQMRIVADDGAQSPSRLLTLAQVAEMLGTSERFPRRLVAERRIEFVRIGRHVRVSVEAVEAYIASGRVEPGHSGSVG